MLLVRPQSPGGNDQIFFSYVIVHRKSEIKLKFELEKAIKSVIGGVFMYELVLLKYLMQASCYSQSGYHIR